MAGPSRERKARAWATAHGILGHERRQSGGFAGLKTGLKDLLGDLGASLL